MIRPYVVYGPICRSGKNVWIRKFLGNRVHCDGKSVATLPRMRDKKRFRCSVGGTTFGWRGRNYWVSDTGWIGSALKPVFTLVDRTMQRSRS